MWLCRAGRYGEFENKFLEDSKVYCTWDNLSESIMQFHTKQDLQQYFGSDMAVMSVLSSDTLEITRTALRILDRIYRPGIWYKKAGVVLTDIHMGNVVQQNLFDTITNRPSRGKLMQVIDDINHRYGIKTLRMSVEGTEKEQPWKSRSLYRSPNYLTDIHEILTVGS